MLFQYQEYSSMRLVFSLVSLLLSLFLVAPAVAASVVDSLQERYASIASMSLEFTQTLTHKESGGVEKRSGLLQFKKPLLVRWETRRPTPELLLVGKDCIWQVFPTEELATKYALSMAQDSRSIIRVVTGQARLDQDFIVEEEGREDGLVRLRLYPKEPTPSLVEALLWVDADAGLIKKIRIYDFYGNENEIAFSKQSIDAALAGFLFTYTPPKNYEVEDKTKDGGAKPSHL
jgi:outer membrane lipoprotein carrier protein